MQNQLAQGKGWPNAEQGKPQENQDARQRQQQSRDQNAEPVPDEM